MPSLLDLPRELLTQIVRLLDRSTLKELRITCRTLSSSATRELFETILLYPDNESYEAIENITDDPKLSALAKKVYVNTCEDDYESGDEGEVEFPSELRRAVRRLKKLPNVRRAVLRFDKTCSMVQEYYYPEPPQTYAFRTHALRAFFSWLAPLQPDEVGIQNLQDYNTRDEGVLADIAAVLLAVKSLRLNIVTQHDSAAPEHDVEFEELHTFFADLPTVWLKPTWASLTHLTLYCDTYFGFYPRLDLTDLHFPNLKTLSLGNFTFVQDAQLEWILSHADTLTELYLDDCILLFDVCLYAEHIPLSPFTQEEMETRGSGVSRKYFRSYNKRWHDYFDAFRTQLPHLQHFRVGSSIWDDGVPFEKETEIKIGMLHDRYMACYDGYGPSPYLHETWDEEDGERAPPKCDEEDRDALRLLLKKTGQVVEDWSEGRYNVVDLLDC